MDSSGDFVIAWDSYGQDGSGYGIYAQRYVSEIYAHAIARVATMGSRDANDLRKPRTSAGSIPAEGRLADPQASRSRDAGGRANRVEHRQSSLKP